MSDEAQIPLRWRPHRAGKEATLYQFVREYLCSHGGVVDRTALLAAMKEDPRIAIRLAGSQGFVRILWNMRNSGWIELDGDMISATRKTFRKESGMGIRSK